MRGRLCSPWPQGQFYRVLVCDDLFFPFPSPFGLGRPWGSPGQLHKRWVQLRSARCCCQSCSPLEREGIHTRGGQVPSSSLHPTELHCCAQMSPGVCGPGASAACWALAHSPVAPVSAGRAAHLPPTRWAGGGRGRGPGCSSPCCLLPSHAPGSATRRLTGKYTECPAHVNKPSYK